MKTPTILDSTKKEYQELLPDGGRPDAENRSNIVLWFDDKGNGPDYVDWSVRQYHGIDKTDQDRIGIEFHGYGGPFTDIATAKRIVAALQKGIAAAAAKGKEKIDTWEVLDCSSTQTFYGVFAQEGYSADPLAIFSSEADAFAWLTWRENEGPEDERLPDDTYTVCPIRRLTGITWNHYDNDKMPAPDETPTIEQVEESR